VNQAAWRVVGAAYLAALCLFSIAPLVVILVSSATGEGYIRFPPHSFGIRWYQEVLSSTAFRAPFVYSVAIAAATSILCGLLGTALAVGSTQPGFPARGLVQSIVLSPLLVAHVVLAIGLVTFFSARGWITAPYGILLGHVLITIPYMSRLVLTSLAMLPRNIQWASESLGASSLSTLLRVTIPSIAPGLIAGMVFAFLISFDEVTISLFLVRPEQVTLPVQIFNYVQNNADPIATTVSAIMILLSLLVVLALERRFGLLALLVGDVERRA
jgi:putative spermidine/putrescine transport system permease protein